MKRTIELPKYTTKFSIKNKLYRLIWNVVKILLFRPFGTTFFNKWRIFLLKCFGAKIGENTIIYSSSNIWMPCNLVVGKRSCIGPNTIIYNPNKIQIGDKVTISQFTYLCGGSHDISKVTLDFVSAPIIIKDFAWVCARCFVMMGVIVEEGCIIGATSSLFSNTEPWSVYGGIPAKFIKKRNITNNL